MPRFSFALLPLLMFLAATGGPVLALEPGDAAPPLAVAQWIGGSPAVAVHEPAETVHVVVFWATWSAPARDSLELLRALQQEFAPQGLKVVAIADEPAVEVEHFVGGLPAPRVIDYAVDDRGRSTALYLGGIGGHAVPHVFVCDRAGRLAWHGHPNALRAVIARILDGSYVIPPPPQPASTPPDDDARADDAGAPSSADDGGQTHREDGDRGDVLALRRMLGGAVNAGAWDQAVEIIDRLIAALGNDAEVPRLLSSKFIFQYEMLEQFDAAQATARELLAMESPGPEALNALAWTLLARGDFEKYEHRWPALAHEAARRAMDTSSGPDAGIIDTYARSLYMLGDVASAVTYQGRAVSTMSAEIEGARQSGADDQFLSQAQDSLGVLESTLRYYEEVLRLGGARTPPGDAAEAEDVP